ncbi:hypothetical protein LshimejAT787_0409870 [Lyophyllum shimeji]|uniref:Uncharacterized protein n=1 Tax=Lyophyllum shimeji TaxID=47721 RepID=A0A9P3PMB6_LYOSH|nr:hypothetical protein LshimejAT787_0409870 [Lyophyllum shimeji]
MEMPIPTPSPYSEDSEGSVLRAFVDESIAQERTSPPSPRSELLSQTSHPARDDDAGDPGPSKRTRRSHQKRRKPRQHELTNSSTSPDDLLRLLVDQKQETHALRKALHMAVERVDSETQRVLSLQRAHSQTAEHFRLLNESRLAAQQDAMRANSELRMYQFQFANAQKEIERAQEVLRVLEEQRDEAEEAARRARAKARKYLQERMVAAAKEEGRRLGFEDGLRRAQEEHAFDASQRRMPRRHNPTAASRRRQVEQDEAADVQDNEPPAADDEAGDDDGVDQMSQLSTPTIHHALRGRRAHASPEVIRVAQPAESIYSQTQRSGPPPESEPEPEQPQLRPPPAEPTPPAAMPTAAAVPNTPSVQVYSLPIPPAAELERQNSLTLYPGRHPQPWVTAQQYGEITGQHVTPRHSLQSNADPQRGSGDVTFGHPQQPQQPQGKRKEAWFRTLSRRLGRRGKSQDEAPATPLDPSPRSASWYTPAPPPKPDPPPPGPPVHVRDFGAAPPQHQSMADTASISTRMSQLDIVSPPNASQTSFGGVGGMKGPTKKLSVINEDPASRSATPAKDMGQPAPPFSASGSSQKAPRDADAASTYSYSNPRAVDEWRRSSASGPREINGHARPRGGGPRRPKHLTVPAPLALENANGWGPGAPPPTQPRANAQNGLRSQESFTSPEPTPIGITVEPPSRSPTEGMRTAGQEKTFLSLGGSSPRSMRTAPVPGSPRSVRIPSASAHPTEPMPSIRSQSAYAYADGPMPSIRPPSRGPDTVRSQQRNSVSRPTNEPTMSSMSPAYPTEPLPSVRPPSTYAYTTGPMPSIRPASISQAPDSVRPRSPRPSSASRLSPKPTDPYPYPSLQAMYNRTVGDNVSVHSAGRRTPRQSYQNLPATNQGAEGTASHRRVVSETHLSPGPSHAPLNGGAEHTLHRVSSNLSAKSAGSKYARYDGSQYLDPAFFPPESGPAGGGAGKGVDKGKGVDRGRRSPSLVRPASVASSAQLSYVEG